MWVGFSRGADPGAGHDDQRQVRQERLRLDHRGADLEAVHDPGARRARRTPASPHPDDKLVFGEKVAVPSVVGRSEADARSDPRRGRVQRRRSTRRRCRSTVPGRHGRVAEPVGHRDARLVDHARRCPTASRRRTADPNPARAWPGWPGNGGGPAATAAAAAAAAATAVVAVDDVRRRPHRGSARARRCGRARVRLAGRGALVHAAGGHRAGAARRAGPAAHPAPLRPAPDARPAQQGRLGQGPGLAGPAPRRRHGRQLGAPRRDAGPAATPWSRTSRSPGRSCWAPTTTSRPTPKNPARYLLPGRPATPGTTAAGAAVARAHVAVPVGRLDRPHQPA